MPFKSWQVPVEATWYRSNELREIRFDRSGLTIRLAEEIGGRIWVLRFEELQGVRITTEECAGTIISALPSTGAFFEADDSQWLQELGKGQISFLADSRHFLIGCYDEIIEVAARRVNIEQER